MTRTDIHRPSAPEFDPQAYDCVGVFDTRPEPGSEYGRHEVQMRIVAINALIDKGYRHGPGSSSQCGHCGARIRYAALMAHTASKEFIFIGETCLDGRFEMTKREFQAKRKAAALDAERAARAAEAAQFWADHPEIAFLTDQEVLDALGNGFLFDLASKVAKYGSLTERQIEAAVTAKARTEQRKVQQAEWAAQAAALTEAGVKVPEGRVTVTGKVLTTKWVDSVYGGSLKMLVQAEEGWKVWGSVPAALDAEEGSLVEFTATITRSDDDPLFGFFKRPTKARIIEGV